MPRSIWRGSLSFGLVTIPVLLFAAENPRELSFHLLDRRDSAPVHNLRVNASTGEEVPWGDVVKGYEYEQGRWVILSDEDFRAANVEATQTIDILGAVCREDIPAEYYDKPYYLAPEKPGRKAYALLREVLKRARRVAVAKVVIRTRQHLALLVPEGDAILLEVMRYPYELRGTEGLELPPSDLAAIGVTEAELAMAEDLVRAMETDWDPSDPAYADSYRDDLLALIARKATGTEIPEVPEVPAEGSTAGEVVDIMALLKSSIEHRRAGGAGASS
jgi:DNA end-binding protein Ku